MSSKVVPNRGEEGASTRGSDSLSPIDRLEIVESSLLTLLQEVRSVRVEIQQQVSKGAGLEPLLEAEQVATLLGLDVSFVYTQARANKIPSIKVGKYRKFSPSQLKKWLDKKNSI
jgi:excisionase family DNA binding protein